VESATDVNAGPLFVLLAVALFPIRQLDAGADAGPASAASTQQRDLPRVTVA
jgi:hypothetical protein